MPPTVIPWFIAIVLPGWTRSQATINRMATWCMRFTPRVHVEYGDGAHGLVLASRSAVPPMPPLLLLDVSGCLRVNGGARRVVGRISRGLTRRGMEHALGSAPTSGQAVVQAMGMALGYGRVNAPVHAHVNAHTHTHGSPNPHHAALGTTPVEQLPFECLRIPEAICTALREVNLTRIGEARVIARSALVDRYGPELMERLDMAAGLRAWPFRAVAPPSPIVGEFVFASPCAQQEAVDTACKQAVESLCAALTVAGHGNGSQGGSARTSRIGCSNGRGVRSLAVRIERARLPAVIGTIHFGAPTRDANHLWSLLRPRIQRMHLGEHERGEGIERILLTAARIGRCPGGMPFLGGAVGMAACGTHERGTFNAPEHGGRHGGVHSGNDHRAATERAIGELVDQLHARLGEGRARRAEA